MGHMPWPKGKPRSEETKRKVSAALSGKNRKERVKVSPQVRFWKKVDLSGGPDACWPREGNINRDGYAQFWVDGRTVRATRWIYEQMVGPIPDGMTMDHICHDPRKCDGGRACLHRRCVNPSHLKPATLKEQVRPDRAHRRGGWSGLGKLQTAKTHCPHGHPYDEKNTIWGTRKTGTPHRICRTCTNAYQRRYEKRRREEQKKR